MVLALDISTCTCKLSPVNDALRINIIVNTHLALSSYKVHFHYNINSIDQSIKFTVEDTHPDGPMLFLVILGTPEPNRTLPIRVYMKPIHMDK